MKRSRRRSLPGIPSAGLAASSNRKDRAKAVRLCVIEDEVIMPSGLSLSRVMLIARDRGQPEMFAVVTNVPDGELEKAFEQVRPKP